MWNETAWTWPCARSPSTPGRRATRRLSPPWEPPSSLVASSTLGEAENQHFFFSGIIVRKEKRPSENPQKISCCRRGSKVASIAVATEAALLWLALRCGGTAQDWLRLGRGCESRIPLCALARMCFPSSRSAAPPVVFPSGRGSRAAGESETANYWRKKTQTKKNTGT